MQSASLKQLMPSSGSSPAGWPAEVQALAPPVALVVVQISPLKALATQSVPVQLTPRRSGLPGRTVRTQAVGPPVGLAEVKTPVPPTTTHWVAATQSTPKSDLALGIFVADQEAAPAPGSVVVQTPPLESTATQRVALGQEIPRRLAFSSPAGVTWPTVQAPAPAVGAVDWTTTPSWPTPTQKPLASQCMPKIVSLSPRLSVVSVQGEAWAAVAANTPPRARTARTRERRRIARFILIWVIGSRGGILHWASTCRISGSPRRVENP